MEVLGPNIFNILTIVLEVQCTWNCQNSSNYSFHFHLLLSSLIFNWEITVLELYFLKNKEYCTVTRTEANLTQRTTASWYEIRKYCYRYRKVNILTHRSKVAFIHIHRVWYQFTLFPNYADISFPLFSHLCETTEY